MRLRARLPLTAARLDDYGPIYGNLFDHVSIHEENCGLNAITAWGWDSLCLCWTSLFIKFEGLRSKFGSLFQERQTPRELFDSFTDFSKDGVKTAERYARPHVITPLAAAAGSLFMVCGSCFSTTIPALLQKAAISLAAVVLDTLVLKFVKSVLRKRIPKALRIAFSIINYQPVVIPVIIALVLHVIIQTFLLDYFATLKANPWWAAFLFLFWWKSVKIIVHTYSYVFLTERNLYRPVLNPKISPKDVTVIIPTVGDMGDEFKRCLESILRNFPARIFISTVGYDKMKKAQKVCGEVEKGLKMKDRRIFVTAIDQCNKRSQFIHALVKIATPITCYADDHVFWPPTYLKHALAPFEDPMVGLVGTVKRVERVKTGSFWDRVLNYIAVIYLERHNFECTASYNIDGGVFVISGRTALTRTEIMHSVDFRQGYLSETWWWGQVGPMKVDDDNYITRFMVNHGYKTVFHNEPAVLMETTLGYEGGVEKFGGQLIRWVRTTWRTNSTSLFAERKIWHAHPWTTFAMMISLFFNISLIYDPLLFFTLYKANYLEEYWCLLFFFLVLSKTIKQVPHLIRNKDDIFPFWILGIFFGYFHSVLKIWAFFTAKNINWCGRKGIEPVARPQLDRGVYTGDSISEESPPKPWKDMSAWANGWVPNPIQLLVRSFS